MYLGYLLLTVYIRYFENYISLNYNSISSNNNSLNCHSYLNIY